METEVFSDPTKFDVNLQAAPMIRKINAAQADILSGWKEIANYIGKGVRSVQRYERELGLPIHRLPEKSAGPVFAHKAELDAWISSGPSRQDLKKRLYGSKRLYVSTNRVGADFLRVDSEVALTFSGIALQTTDEENRKRTTRTARRAYDTIMQLRENIDFSEAERNKLDANLQRLKSELQSLGESF